MAEYTLPNGRVITGLSDGYTPEQIKAYAIAKGYATEKDYNTDVKTKADMLPTVGEVGGSIAGSILGGMVAGGVAGTAGFPVIGTAIGALAGGAIGAFAGNVGGNVAEAALENRKVDTEAALKEGAQAAAYDVAFGAGLGAAGAAVRAIGKPLIRLASPAIQRTFDLDSAARLQNKLKAYGTSLLPSQVQDATMLSRAAETYAASSVAFRPEYERMLQGYEQYAIDSTKAVLNTMKGRSREEVGAALRTLSDETEKAVSEIVDPLYKDLDIKGGLTLLTDPVKQAATSFVDRISSGGVGRLSRQADLVYKMLQGLPAEMSPALMTKEIAPMIPTMETLAKADKSGQAASLLNILKGTMDTYSKVPALVDASGIASKANAEALQRVGATGEERVSGEYAQAIAYLRNMRPKMSFTETRKELSYLKSRLRDMENPVSPNSAAGSLYASAVAALENSMEAAAKNFNPELYAQYRYVSDFYKKAEQTIHSPFMKDALRAKDVATVGDLLSKVGSVTPIKELDELVALADSMKVTGGQSVREGLTRNYLENIFRAGDLDSLSKFNANMANPRFKDTFETIVPKRLAKQVSELAKEAEILTSHLRTPGTSIGITGRETAAATSPFNPASWLYGILPNLVSGRLSNEAVSKKIAAMKAVNMGLSRGSPVSSAALRVLDIAPSALAGAGAATGAAAQK